MNNTLLAILAATILLVGCAPSLQADSAATTNMETDGTQEFKIGDVTETEGGTFTLIAKKDFNQTFETGPMKLTVPTATVGHVKTKGALRELLKKDEVDYVSVYMVAENTHDQKVYFIPDSVLVTNTGEQIEMPTFLLSAAIGGYFYGKVRKEGEVVWLLKKSKPEDIKWVKIIAGKPHDGNKFLSEKELEIKIEF